MKNYFLLTSILFLFNFCINVYSENAYYIIGIKRKETDKNYYHESQNVQNQIDQLVNDRMNDIYNVIEENKDTYSLENGKLDEKLDELNSIPLEKRSDKTKKFLFINKLKKNNKDNNKNINFSKRSNNSTVEYIPFESELVNHICPVLNYYTISVYLSEKTAKTVCQMKNIFYCQKSQTFKMIDIPKSKQINKNNKINKNKNINDKNNKNKNKKYNKNKDKNNTEIINNENTNIYYDINDIKKETKWSNVNVQSISYSPNLLNLISQRPFINPNKTIDSNFYYPSTAGKGIDIYFIDEGLNINHEDFNRYEGTPDERIITCDATFIGQIPIIADHNEINQCTNSMSKDSLPSHGIMVSSLAGGTLYGVAKKANLHMIANDLEVINILRSFDFILEHGKPHKTVISMSLGGISEYYQVLDDKFTELIDNGFIIFSAAGNDQSNLCDFKFENQIMNFQGYRKSIVVGAATLNSDGTGYVNAPYSNYGHCIDIFAPFDGLFPNMENGSTTDVSIASGTSASTPVVAGVAATIMSEHPEINFDLELMRKTLIEMSIKDAINFNYDFFSYQPLKYINSTEDTPNRFLNNGKKSIYYPDEPHNHCGGNTSNVCDGGCCTKDGKCISFENLPGDQCFIVNGCQDEFGYCTTQEKSIEDCEKELKENEECFVELDINEEVEEIIEDEKLFNLCSIINSQKCQKFYNHQLSNQSVCSIAKNHHKFEYYDHFNRAIVSRYTNICNTIKTNCNNEIHNNYSDCIYWNDYHDFNFDTDYEFLRSTFFIEQCINVNSDKCQRFYKNLKEEILNNTYCSFRYEMGDTTVIDISNIFDRDDTNLTFTTYENFGKKCKSDIEEHSIDYCNKELEEYKEQFIDLPNNNTSIDEIVKNCNTYENYYHIYEYPENEFKMCYYVQQMQPQKVEKFEKLKEIYNVYSDLCYNPSKELEEKIKSECEKRISPQCLFEYYPGMEEEEISQKCELFESNECQIGNGEMNINLCYTVSLEDFDDESYLKYDKISELCSVNNDEKIRQEYVDECEFNLNIINEFCMINEETVSTYTLEYQCSIYLSCKPLFELNRNDLYNQIQGCDIGQYFKNFDILPTSNEYEELYKEKCLQYINANTTSSTTSTTTTTTITTTTTTITTTNISSIKEDEIKNSSKNKYSTKKSKKTKKITSLTNKNKKNPMKFKTKYFNKKIANKDIYKKIEQLMKKN